MKVKNAKENHILDNRIVKHIILEAPTASELEKKIKKYEIILARALTNLYQISELSLNRDGLYHLTPNGNLQAIIYFHFSGIKRQHVPFPEQTVKDLEQLTILESSKEHESPLSIRSKLAITNNSESKVINFEVDEVDKLEEAICNRQRYEIEKLINSTCLEHISFLVLHKKKNFETSKIIASIECRYKTRKFDKNINTHSTHDEHEEK